MKNDLLLLSNSSVFGRGYLEHALVAIEEFLTGRTTVHFAPYALKDHDGYTQRVESALAPFGVTVVGLHATVDPVGAVEEAEVIIAKHRNGPTGKVVLGFQPSYARYRPLYHG